MPKISIFLFLLLSTFCTSIAAQKLKVKTKLTINDNDNYKYDEKYVNIYLQDAKTTDFLGCAGFIYFGSPTDHLNFMYSCVCVSKRATWKFLPDLSNDKRKCFIANCKFAYSFTSYSSLVESETDVTLIKYTDGRQTIMVPNYDNIRTLILEF